ncbi:MAG TPA: FecR domain-containing protein [Pedobacter sp.]|jgi:ferric-dicitrate binding protein FerR (iron transport regulator)
MNSKTIESLLDRYQKGETSAEENILVEKWLDENNNPNSQWQILDTHAKQQWLGDTFIKIHETINEPKVIEMPSRPLWKKIAAVAAVVSVFLALFLQVPSLFHEQRLTKLSVPANQKKQLTLPDGSMVWVNAGSELKYPEKFEGKTREVYLSGEAYFDVEHDASKEFIIHTGKVVTTVLGTAFNIKEDKNKETVVVTVTRGKVKVANGTKELGIITANQQISFNSQDSESVQNQVNASKVIAWQEEELSFEDITFAEVAVRLEQRFNVEIRFVNDKLKTCRFTGKVQSTDKLEKILKVICAFNNATFQTHANGSITIDGAGCEKIAN